MKSQRLLCVSVVVLLMVCLIAPVASMAQTKSASGTKAGNISALLPVATIDRGTGKNKTTVEAKKGDDVVWNDLVKTQKGGRARITLNDQSVLSLGSQAELRILKHDSRTQQTALQLGYGRIRAEVASVTRDGGKFELRTPTAVAGVIGTDFGTDSSIPGVTTFLCISGIVTVGNSDAKVPGTVPCPAGSTTSVSTGLPPTPPKPATQQQIQQLILDTEPAVISSLSPGSALQGVTVAASASGSKMAGINAVSISGTGVKVSISAAATDTNIGIKVETAADATAGPRTITFTKANGQSTAALFTVLEPPSAKGTVDIAALKKAYDDIIDQERQSEIAGLNAIGLGVQQSAGDTLALILAENKKLGEPLDQAKIEQNLGEDVLPLLKAMEAAGVKLNDDAANAMKEFDTAADAAFNQIKARKSATPDEDTRNAVKDVFDKVNKALLAKFKLTHDGLGGDARAVNARLGVTENRWLEAIKIEMAIQKSLPLPKTDADERSYDQGLMASFDAVRSKGANGANIASYSWVLCDPSYKPQQIGVPLPANDNKCRPLSGYGSTSSDFRFQTCQLDPQDYIARVTVIDDKQKAASVDVRLKVLKGDYEDPASRLRSAAAAFETLQSERFMAFFDISFANYGSLSESIRRTFESLASMTINLRVSQATINCNEATVRADWQQNYTFKADGTCDNLPAGTVCQRVLFTQTEQLTSRMLRVADSAGSRILGWNIIDLQGDNGTVQGTPPGPRIVDTASPDLIVQGLATSGAQGVAFGTNTFLADVQNVGSGPLSAPAKIRFAALGPNNVEVASDVQDVPIPLGVGQSIGVIGKLDIPNSASLQNVSTIRIVANVNPSCTVNETKCDGSNTQQLDFLFGTIDLQVSKVTPVGTLFSTFPGSVTVDVTNLGSRTSVATTGNLKVGPAANNLTSGGVSVPAIAPGATVTVAVPFTVPATAGAQTLFAGLSPASPFDINASNDVVPGSINVVGSVVNLQLVNLAYSAGIPLLPPFLSGQIHTVSFDVKNTLGNVPSAASDTYSCTLTGTSGTHPFPPLALPQVAPGATVTGLTFTFSVPVNFAGADTLTCATSADPFGVAAQASLATQVNANVDLQLVNVPVQNVADQMGGSSTLTFGVQNFGLDTAPGGYDVVFKINGTVITPTNGPTTGPSLIGGQSTSITINYLVPQIGVAPQDVIVPETIQVNVNGVVAEANTANNCAGCTSPLNLRLVDFTLSTIPTGPLTAVAGRSFNSTVVSVLPLTYPLPLNVVYTGAPAGLTNAGSQSANILGTQLGSNGITDVPGTFTITPSAAVQGIPPRTASNISLQLLPEISMSMGTAFALTANGPPQPFQVQVTGGVNPINLNLTLPAGVTIAAGPGTSTSVASPGAVTWQLQSSTGAAIGNGLTNIVVVASDAGIGANNVGAGNVIFAPPYTNGGFDNYIILAGGFLPPHTNGQALDSLQVGETATVLADVKNVGNSGQIGNMDVQLTCVPSCGGPYIATVAAPAPGATVTVQIPVPVSFAVGNYAGTLGIVAASTPPQSNTADDTLPLPFDVFDFGLTSTAPISPRQNVPLNGSGNFGVSPTESGPAATIPVFLPLTVANLGSTGTNAPGTVQGGVPATVTMFGTAGVVSGTLDTVTASSTRFGVTKSASQDIKYFTAGIVNTTSGGLGDSSGNHAIIPLGGGGVNLQFKITGDFDATVPGTVSINASNGILTTLTGSPGSPNDTFDIQFAPSGPTVANGTETVIDLVLTVPHTNPVQQIVKHVYLFPVLAPDLSVSMVPAGISAGRIFNGSDPLISGEGAEFMVTVQNSGSGASSSNLKVTLQMSSTLLSQTTIPSVPAGFASPGSISFLVHIRAPEPVGTAGANSIFLAVQSDPLETNTGNNFVFVPIATSDWHLNLVGTPTGGSTDPLNMPSNTIGGTTVQAIANLSGAVVSTPITVVTAGVSTGISATPPAGALVPIGTGQPPQGPVSISTGSPIPAGEYAVQLVGRVTDGGITSERGITVHIKANGGVPTPVAITSSVGNSQAGNPGTCSGGCTVRQINGALSDTLNLTATGGTGTVDLIFTDSNAIVSNVSVPSGSPGPEYINAVPYNAPRSVSFAPFDSNGNVSAGPANVIVSAVAATTAARGGPIQPTVGTQQTTLYFNIGDLNVTPSNNCGITIAPGATVHVDMSFLPNSGFNQSSLLFNWTSFGGTFVTLAQSNSGISTFVNPGYTTAGFDFTNHEAANLGGVNFNLDVTIQGANGSQATKHFAIPVWMSSGPCLLGAANREGSSMSSLSPSGGYWTRGIGGGSASTSIRREAPAPTSGLPDLQIKSTDVSISPSVPKSGDKVDVRFKVTNAGAGIAKQVPIALQVNGTTVASDKYDLAAGASTLGALQWLATVPDNNVQTDRPRRSARGGGDVQDTPPAQTNAPQTRFDAKLVIDPAATVPQASATLKAVQLSKMMLRGGPAEATTVMPMDRVFLEVGTICVGFRLASGSGSECESGADVDLSIVDFATSRFELIAQLGIADLGVVNAGAANLSGVQFGSRTSLIVGHTYAVQLSAGKVGLMTIVRQLTPMQLAAEAKRRFGRSAIRIVSRLGGSTGAVEAGDVSGTTRGSDALTYFELAFTAQQ